jgi:hypothetical protein
MYTCIHLYIHRHINIYIYIYQIDVEGDELDVVYGINTKFHIIKQIIIEVHDINDRLVNVVKLLTEKGFLVTFDHQKTEVLIYIYVYIYIYICIYIYIYIYKYVYITTYIVILCK